MRYKTHLAFGLLVGLIAFPFLSIKWYFFFPLVLLAALLPDGDHPNSWIGRRLGFFSKLLNFVAGHRGITHSIWIPILLMFLFWMGFGLQYGLAIMIGYMSHVLSDALTVQGINLIHPLQKLHISGFVKTGSWGEWVVFFLVMALIVYQVVGMIL